MPLETTECISIVNKGRAYTDCMEFSLLRFLQLLAHCPEQIKKSCCSDYLGPVNSGPVGEFIKAHGQIFQSGDYYLDGKSPGVTERADWAEFVSGHDFLHYYRNDSAELFTSVSNIIRFFNGFYNLNLSLAESDYGSSLDAIGEYFTTDQVRVSMDITGQVVNVHKLSMREICRMISRPDDEYTPNNSIYTVCICNTTIELEINESNYIWTLYEVYFKDPVPFTNKYITGHSVIRSDEY